MTKDIKDSNELLTNGKLREQLIDKIEVLDRVKELLLLPKIGLATTQQVADFYEVSFDAIEKIASRNSVELAIDGYGLYKRHDFRLESMKGKVIVTMDNGDEIVIPNRGLRIFPRRAILRVRILLSDSPIAKKFVINY
ncbi:hypothetical protein [Bacillus cereus]|uniref:hypothetical protein n=1 Tax=Bacillus cereus TaxID=1396 RepID=UPI0018CC7F9F|nr:hypothetical protein [Bacillus cereus]